MIRASRSAVRDGERNVVKQLGLLVAGLAIVVVLNVLLVMLARPHVIRTEGIVTNKAVTTL